MKLSNPEKEWFEVWYVAGVDYIPAHLVSVSPNPKNQDEIIVLDITKNEIIYKNQSYENVHDWLTEDEFSLIKGREFPNGI